MFDDDDDDAVALILKMRKKNRDRKLDETIFRNIYAIFFSAAASQCRELELEIKYSGDRIKSVVFHRQHY